MLDLATQQDAIGARLADVLTKELAPVGIAVPTFIIENISLPPEVEAAIDTRSRMGIAGNLDQFTQFQAANAIGEAARNPGGGAGEGVGLGLGMAMGQRMASSLSPQAAPAASPQPPSPSAAAPAGPPPLPQQKQWFVAVGGAQQGPYDDAALAGLAGAGTLTRTSLLWREGMSGWLPAEQVPEAGRFFAAVPPPLPPQA